MFLHDKKQWKKYLEKLISEKNFIEISEIWENFIEKMKKKLSWNNFFLVNIAYFWC